MSLQGGWTLRPERRDVVVSLRWAVFLTVLFLAVYLGCNLITSQRAGPYRLWFDWELDIPFVPAMVWVYFSLFVGFFLPMFALREPALNVLCKRLAFAVVVSGFLFLLLPTQLGFERPAEVSGQAAAFRLIYLFDRPHNLVPSLHVSWSALILGSLRAVSPPWGRRILEAWFLLLCTAAVLVHQHHLLDLLGGMLVAWVACHAVGGDRTSFRIKGEA